MSRGPVDQSEHARQTHLMSLLTYHSVHENNVVKNPWQQIRTNTNLKSAIPIFG